MSDSTSIHSGYSSDVRLSLKVDDREFSLHKIGPSVIVLREGVDLPPSCRAEIIMFVDGRERRWKVILPDGAVPFDTVVPIEEAD